GGFAVFLSAWVGSLGAFVCAWGFWFRFLFSASGLLNGAVGRPGPCSHRWGPCGAALVLALQRGTGVNSCNKQRPAAYFIQTARPLTPPPHSQACGLLHGHPAPACAPHLEIPAGSGLRRPC